MVKFGRPINRATRLSSSSSSSAAAVAAVAVGMARASVAAADKKTALKKAEFLAECLCRDVQIDTKTAEEAIERSQSQHQKWWKIAPSTGRNGVSGSAPWRSIRRTADAAAVSASRTDEEEEEEEEETPLRSEQHHVDSITCARAGVAGAQHLMLLSPPWAPKETRVLQGNGSVKRRYQQEEVGKAGLGSTAAEATALNINKGSIGASEDEDDDDDPNNDLLGVDELRRAIIAELTAAKGDTTTPQFVSLLHALHRHHSQIDPAEHGSPYNGEWRLISGPSYHECKGANDSGQALYTLGRMSFDMFRPADLKCSMGRIMNLIDDVGPPTTATATTTGTSSRGGGTNEHHHQLQPEPLPFPLRLIRQSNPHISEIKRYDIITEIFIEVDEDLYRTSQLQSRRVPAILTTRGYCMIDSRCPGHLSIWFSSGSLTRCESEVSLKDWRRIFDDSDDSSATAETATSPTSISTDDTATAAAATTTTTLATTSSKATTSNTTSSKNKKLLNQAESIARRVFLGAESFTDDDGNLHFTLHRPIGGSNKVYVDTIYADDSLRILRGNHGSILVFEREIDNFYYASSA